MSGEAAKRAETAPDPAAREAAAAQGVSVKLSGGRGRGTPGPPAACFAGVLEAREGSAP